MNLSRFETTLLALRVGEAVAYHTGNLAEDRAKLDEKSPKRIKPLTKESAELDALATLAYGLSLIGAAQLGQERISGALHFRKYKLRAVRKLTKTDFTAALAANLEDEKRRSER